ncbi:beta-glucosidase [Lysobacter sp. CA196]|uniref:beta-glucosidase family protein n=1 Tax=Lysobacter sp. CA196 TaxID=3455606 RepID=UPI003F8D38E3
MAGAIVLLAALAVEPASAGSPARPWQDRSLCADARADLLLAEMTLREKLRLVHSDGAWAGAHGKPPAGAIGGAGFIPANPRLGLPAIQETDAGLGIANPKNVRPGDGATALPSQQAIAATWDPRIAEAAGAMIGDEAHRKGYNVLLAGGVNLQREPRNGRNFEYPGEDPLLAGRIVGATVRGIQAQHVLATVKHYALNAQETGRLSLNARIGETALRGSDLLAFELAIEYGHPGAVMCAYNRVNGSFACESATLIERILKGDWKYPGFVMSDWGAIADGAKAIAAGLDQESGEDTHFGAALDQRIAAGGVAPDRIDAMVRRILRSMFAAGLFDVPASVRPIDVAGHLQVSRRVAEAGAVLLRNSNRLLPLSARVSSIAVVGAHSDIGVIGGGGAATVVPWGGRAAIALPAPPPHARWGPVMYYASSPLRAIRAKASAARVDYASGSDIAAAVALAERSEVAVVFVQQWASEGFDLPDLEWSAHQNALVTAVAAANPNTVVVLQNSAPLNLPWLDQVGAVLEVWYPGASGGEAIANLLFGAVDPSGRLPFTWQRNERQLPRPLLPYAGEPQGSAAIPAMQTIDYDIEGADVGYRWFDRNRSAPLFPFGFGLSYTAFDYGAASVSVAEGAVATTVDIVNTGSRPGSEVVQVYVRVPGAKARRLAGFQKVHVPAGGQVRAKVIVEPRLLAEFDALERRWVLAGGEYEFQVGRSAEDLQPAIAVELPPGPVCTDPAPSAAPGCYASPPRDRAVRDHSPAMPL